MSIKNIFVLVKQVPDTNEIKIDQQTGTLIRQGIPSIMNPDDKHGLEEALRIKDKTGAKVTVLTMGPPQAEAVLIEALGMGADKAVLVTDRAFAGADTLATSYTLTSALKKLGDFDLICAGREAIDGDTAQVGPQIAEQLNIPQVTYVKKVDVNGKTLTVQRALEDGYYDVKVDLPCLLTVIKDLNTPRYPHIGQVFDAFNGEGGKELIVWGVKDLDVDEARLGLKGSPTKVKKSFSPTITRAGEILGNGDLNDAVQQLKVRLKERHLI
jgi:electron transfer flavoprotein beta subunit